MLNLEKYNWTEWWRFPDPRKGDVLVAPFGMGLYQLKNDKTGEYILFGVSNNCAYRMTSLLPNPLGQGTRNNEFKRQYVLENITHIKYRTISFIDYEEMKFVESKIKKMKIHKFNS